MPTLHWVGKNKVVNHHHEVPFRLLDKKYSFAGNEGTPANSTNNKIIHGDNLEALKSLLPEFEGKVNCIYIDPPYNTGNEGWVYNDNVNDPKIKKWLGQVVGKEGEDLSRHDKWLCMMYPRLKMLHRLLADDGVIFVSIDDNEVANLRLLMDEIFGRGNFIAEMIWEGAFKNTASQIGVNHEYVILYAQNKSKIAKEWNIAKDAAEPVLKEVARLKKKHGEDYETASEELAGWFRANKANECFAHRRFRYIDKRGAYKEDDPTAPGGRKFELINPKNGNVIPLRANRGWAFDQATFNQMVDEGRVSFVTETTIMIRRYFHETDTATPQSVFYQPTRSASERLASIIGAGKFEYPKDETIVQKFFEMVAGPNSVILDSFAGSGTTAHAVLNLNAQDGGNRRFILCEMMDYADTLTAERVRRVINGYGEAKKSVAGLGGGFEFYTVGTALFREDKNLNEEVGAEAIRGYVAYTENIPTEQRWDTENAVSQYALGSTDSALCVFYYEKDRVTTLDIDFLGTLNIKNLPSRPEQFVIYADKCALDRDFLYKHGITFKRIPRDITRF
ncbi:site-specific DNA-methyltransferase [Rhodocyclus tenuis]|uniref:site-specific DNA-methyltransferase (adenine-specific) n=2 Tax=Rhodocyclus TaxID=1064 RepID=A0A6L5JVW4_RHOTE|nr:site-specific DNA-methyltransferase [Rhodocyclus gracilis]